MSKVHRTNDKQLIKHIRTVSIPYTDIMEVLEKDGEAFLEADKENPLKRQTIWRAARLLSQRMGKTVRYNRSLFRIDGVDVLEGYSFSIEGDPQARNPSENAS